MSIDVGGNLGWVLTVFGIAAIVAANRIGRH